MVNPIDSDAIERLLTVANGVHVDGAEDDVTDDGIGPVHDHLRDPEDARRFLKRSRVAIPAERLTPDELADLRRLRRAVMALVDGDSLTAAQPLLRHAAFRLDAAGHLRAMPSGWRGFITDLLPALVELRGQRDRLKVCASPTCQWLFLDRSKNHARIWCDMAVCGNRAKVKRFQARARVGA